MSNQEPILVEQLLSQLKAMTQYARTVGDASLPSLQTMFSQAEAAIARGDAAMATTASQAQRAADADLDLIAQRVTELAGAAEDSFEVCIGIALTGVVSLAYDANEQVDRERLRKALFENFLQILQLDELQGSLDAANLIDTTAEA